MINPKRYRILRKSTDEKGPVLYWMSRDQRINDNWALLHAQDIALLKKQPLFVCFCLVPSFLGATIRQYGFMLKGLKEAAKSLKKKNIPFLLLKGDPKKAISFFAKMNRIKTIVSDFNPLKISKRWKEETAKKINCTFHEVDAHNIVPCWIASPKQEFGAYTIRTKIERLLDEFLEEFPPLKKHAYEPPRKAQENYWQGLRKDLKIDRTVLEVSWIRPGEREARRKLDRFIAYGMDRYPDLRNDPSEDAQSGLSPYIHFGQISTQRIALEVRRNVKNQQQRKAFLEELIVRRELSDNFCFYNKSYDSFEGFPDWAKKTLNEHRKDERNYNYGLKDLEFAKTHDPLWNAAEMEMVRTGRMHGYMRMYWAKKILEWSRTPEEALKIAIYLNDRYELDGRDPNGYTGIAWSIGGVHDRAWGERPIFGKVRYMSLNGARSKFDIEKYIKKYNDIK